MCLSFWWWVCIILNTVYKSTMLSTVVNPPTMEPENLEQLLDADYQFMGNIQFSDIIRDLLHVPDPLFIKTLSKIQYGKDTCNVFDQILKGHMAMLDELSTIQFEIRNECPAPDRKTVKWLRIGRQAIRSTGHAWATQRGAPFRPAIDHLLNLILSSGHFKKWTKDVTNPLQVNQIPMSREAKYKNVRRLTLKRFFPVLAIYFTGISIAIICFIGEITFTYVVVI